MHPYVQMQQLQSVHQILMTKKNEALVQSTECVDDDLRIRIHHFVLERLIYLELN